MDGKDRAALLKRWIEGKEMERQIREEMLSVETELLKFVEVNPTGSKTSHIDGYKVTVKCPINRTIDGDKWEEVKDLIPIDFHPIKVKIEPDAKGCTWLRENRPELWFIAAEAITEKPGKPGFTVEVEEKE